MFTRSNNELLSPIRSDLLNYKLVIDVMWADIPLITDGASVHAWKLDDTTSQKWRLVKA